jgi:cell division protein FtsN
MKNKQLGFVFLAVVALLPIFFTVGFYLGRNSGQLTASENPFVAGLEQMVTAKENAKGTANPAGPASENTQTLSGEVFLQVAAVDQENAEALQKVLANNGFQVRLSPVPGRNLIRALVGPVQNLEELNSTRIALGEVGFKSFPRRY